MANVASPSYSAPPAANSDLLESCRLRMIDAWHSAGVALGEWAGTFQAFRDRAGRVPAPPAAFWFGGLAGLICVVAYRLMSFRWRLDRGRPADARVLRTVRSVARGMGLKSVPETLVVSDRVSPMIWCGRRARLVLPEPLWNELDEVGRRAIVAHELAHLRRGDHWVCRLALLLSGVFWWHPVLWWVRRRLNEEADLACDAWVTWLMPRERRAYAEALLRTKAYVSDRSLNVPAAGIGVANGRVRSMARRIKMVMTQTVRPRESMAGLTLAMTLAVIGWVATPAWTFAGDEKCEKAAPTAMPAVPARTVAVTVPKGAPTPSPALAPAPAAVADPLHTLQYSAPRGAAYPALAMYYDERGKKSRSGATAEGDGHDDLQQRVERLEHQLAELRAAMHGGRGLGGSAGAMSPFMPRSATTPTPPAPPPVAGFGGGVRGGAVGGAFGGSGNAVAAPLSAAAGGGASGGLIIRAYKLPKRKLDAIFALLSPDDVPLRVRKLDDAIEVHGSAREHEVFKAFIDIINPDGKQSPASTSRARSRTSRRSTGGTETAVELGRADQGLAAMTRARRASVESARVAELLASAGTLGADRQAAAAELLERAAALDSTRDGTRAQVEQLHKQMEELYRASESQRTEAQDLMRKAEEEGAKRAEDSALQMKRELEVRARALESQTRELESQSRTLESQARELERAADDFERRAEELRGKAEELRENDGDDDTEISVNVDSDDDELSLGEAPEVPEVSEPAEMPEPAEIPEPGDDAEPGTPPSPPPAMPVMIPAPVGVSRRVTLPTVTSPAASVVPTPVTTSAVTPVATPAPSGR